MDYEVDLCQLSPVFFQKYPQAQYPELLHKESRPYTCLMIETHENYLICIPFRSSIRHKEAFLFSATQRSMRTNSGLDFKKTVLIQDTSLITPNDTVLIDNDEYTEMMKNIKKIVDGIHNYISAYINHINGTAPLHQREFVRRYQYATLPYFHDILNLERA